jgi:O-antigen/teichoic acid export membrane protein
MAESKKSLVADVSLLFISTLIVNIGNYLINLLLGRWLEPADFSEVSLLITFLLMVSFFALAFQLTSAKFVATYEAENQSSALISQLHYFLNKNALRGGIILMVILLVSSYFLQGFFKMQSYWPIGVFALSLPFYFLMSVNRGTLQGSLSYKKLSLTYQSEMWVRFFVTVLFVYFGVKVLGVAVGLTVSLIVTWWVSRIQNDKTSTSHDLNKKQIISFLMMILLYECSQILINNIDLILVKHFFDPKEAGLYSALALVGRIVYFGTWTVVAVLFPVVIKLEKEAKNHLPYFIGGLALVGTMATGIVLACYFFPELIVQILLGSEYASIAPFLWKYALSTALFACSNVFVYYHLSLGRTLPIWITIFAGVLQIVLITLFHQDFSQVIGVQIYIMIGLLLIMLLYQLSHKFLKM